MAGGSTPRKCGWPSGKPIRPPPGAGVAHTGRPAALGQRHGGVPAAAGVDVGPGDHDRARRGVQARGQGARPARGRRPAAPLTRARRRSAPPRRRRPPRSSRPWAATGTPGPAGGSEARWMPRASAAGTSSGAGRLVAPLDQRVGHPRGVAVGQVGLHGHVGPHLLAGGDQQRRLVGLGVEDRAHGVAQARRGVQVHVAHGARGLGEAVGHAHRHRLLQGQHVA